jgi:hypothetical protein
VTTAIARRYLNTNAPPQASAAEKIQTAAATKNGEWIKNRK